MYQQIVIFLLLFVNMFNPSTTIPPRSSLSLPQIIDKATDELLLGADWNVNMQLVDIINRNNEQVYVQYFFLTSQDLMTPL